MRIQQYGSLREVIEPQEYLERETLESYSAQAYARTTLSNDSGIVAIMEGASTAWWTGTRIEGNQARIPANRQRRLC